MRLQTSSFPTMTATTGGMVPTPPNDATKYLDGTGVFSVPAGGSSHPDSNINGWTYANAAGDVVNDIDIAAGSGWDSTRAYYITGAASTKRLDAAWAVGSGNGGLDTGSIGNSDYYIWAIARSDTGVIDYLYSLSSTAPTMPASYDYKRLIGWFKRVGATIVLFHTYETEGGGIELIWSTPTLEVNITNTLTTSRRTDAMKVPLNFSTIAHISFRITDVALASVYLTCPDTADIVPTGNSDNSTFRILLANAPNIMSASVRTSATGTIASRSDVATVDLYTISTRGFIWARRV
jgi:hypothetical protein